MRWADAIERTAYNALPGGLGQDFTRVQYFYAVNQMLATSTSNQRTYGSARMSYRAAHDTECCAGNVLRGLPNHVARMWMRVAADDGIAAVFYGPSHVHAAFKGHAVDIQETTDYPIRDRITFTIHTDKPSTFPLQLRIPGWCMGASVLVNGTPATGITCKTGSFIRLVRACAEGDIGTLTLHMAAQTVRWFDGHAASIERGPLVFSLKIAEQMLDIARDTDQVRQQLMGNNIQGIHALDILPLSEWRYGIGAAITLDPDRIRVIERPMTDNPFLAASTPVELEAPLRLLPKWLPDWDAHAKGQRSPLELPQGDVLAQPGAPERKTMIPFGATHLRLTTLALLSVP